MLSINTKGLRRAADLLDWEAPRYNDRLSVMDDCMIWLKHQEFREKEELIHLLKIQRETMMQEQRKLLILSRTLKGVCEEYEGTEQQIVESGRYTWKRPGIVNTVNLKQVKDYLRSCGIQIEDL